MGNRLALCIGINKYVNADQINLRYAKNDCEEYKIFLQDPLRVVFTYTNSLVG